MPLYHYDPAVLETPAQICDVHHNVALGPHGCVECNAAEVLAEDEEQAREAAREVA